MAKGRNKQTGPVLVGRQDRQSVKGKLAQSPSIAVMSPPTITQRDLAEVRLLEIEARDAIRALKVKRLQIRQALASGAGIEPGLRTATFEARQLLLIRG